MREREADVERDIRRCHEERKREEVERDERANRPILEHLRTDDCVAEECPERGCDKPCMNRAESRESGGALFEECPGREELQGERERVEREKMEELEAADSRFSPVSPQDQDRHENYAEAADDDVGDVADRVVEADAQDATFGVDTYGGCCCIGRCIHKDGDIVVFELAVEEVAPGIGWDSVAEGREVPELGHRGLSRRKQNRRRCWG